MSQIVYSMKQAYLSLKQKPGFVVSIVTTMGLTLGVLLCVMTLAYLLLFKPLPYPEQDKLYKVKHVHLDSAGKVMFDAFTYPALIHLYENQTVFSQAALINYAQSVIMNHAELPTVETTFVSAQWFTLTDIPMEIGRGFKQTEAINSHNPVAVLSYESWQNEFAANPEILKHKIEISGISYRIIGVTAKSFIEPQIRAKGYKTKIWLPWDFNPVTKDERESWINTSGSMFLGKIANGVSNTQAAQTITPLINDKWQAAVAGDQRFAGKSIKMELQSLESIILGDSEKVIYLLLAGVIGLVLIACSNISNLFVSRTSEQQRQLSIHAAMGAKQKHLFMNLFCESGLLMFFSIILALMIASTGFLLLQNFVTSQLPRIDELSLNSFTLVSAILLAFSFAFFFALLSSKMIKYKKLNTMIQASGKCTGVQVSKWLRQSLIVCQIAVATLLIFINISLFKEAFNTINTPMNFKVGNVLSLRLASSTSELPPAEAGIPVINEIRKKLLALPQVASVSQAKSPLHGFNLWWPGMSITGDEERFSVVDKIIDEQYFQLIGQDKIAGEFFSSEDVKDKKKVIIINDSMAQVIAPDGDALGKKLSFRDEIPFTVIGVVKSVNLPKEDRNPLKVYIPSSPVFPDITWQKLHILIKLKENQTLNRLQVVEVMKEVSSMFSVFKLESLESVRKTMLFTQFTTAITSAVLALLTLFLAGLGIYGILSYSTQIRRFEIGTRMAIGAKRKDLIKLILTDNAGSILLGIITSIIVLLALTLGFNKELENYLTLQLLPVFVVTLGLISLISFFACYLPLRQYINQPAIFNLRES